MARHALLLVGAYSVLVFFPAARAEPPAPKLASKYRLEAEVRKEGNARTVALETHYDSTAGRLYFATPDHKGLASVPSAEPTVMKDAVRAQWVRRFDLPVRGWDEKEFGKDTPQVLVEVFNDATPKRLVYVSESGAIAVLPQPVQPGAKPAAPRWLYRLQLKVRPGGENDFTRDSLKLNVEVYLHEPTGHLIYVGHNGALAVVEATKEFGNLMPKPAAWSHALELKARKPGQDGFDRDTPRISMEVYADENAGVLLYATDALMLAAAPGAAAVLPEKIVAPLWKYALSSGRFSAEVFENRNAGHTLAVTSAGALAVLPAGAKPANSKPPRPNAPGVIVAGVGVLAPSGKVLFLPGEAGTEAVAVFNGKALWSTEGSGEPLLATADHVFSQVEVKGKPNQVKLVVLDATTGERLRESEAVEFPDWVSVPTEYGRSFRSAARLDSGDVLFVWEARAFQDGGAPPPDPDPNAKFASGAFRLDVKTGRVRAVKDYKPKDEEFPDTLGTKTRAGGWAFWVEGVPTTGTTGPRYTVPRVLKAERQDGTASWKRPIVGAVHLLPRP